MTFSDPEVQKVLDTQFVLTWHNQAQDLFPGKPGSPGDHQPAVSEHYLRTFPDGAGGGNVRMFFCTADARIVHSIEGYYRPATFLAEVAFAQQLMAVAGDPAELRNRVAARQALLDRELGTAEAAGAAPHRALLLVLRRNLERLAQRLLDLPDRYMVSAPHAIA
ncbi:MAG TPA: hypothetical protein VFD82_18820 [Planctomycetota bacterium]|nr:hypothetical protein [Planctomycetota bacterium]